MTYTFLYSRWPEISKAKGRRGMVTLPWLLGRKKLASVAQFSSRSWELLEHLSRDIPKYSIMLTKIPLRSTKRKSNLFFQTHGVANPLADYFHLKTALGTAYSRSKHSTLTKRSPVSGSKSCTSGVILEARREEEVGSKVSPPMAAGKKKKGGVGEKRKKNENKGKSKRSRERAVTAEEFVLQWAGVKTLNPGLFDLHSHSSCSDGLLSPELVVARAFRNGVRVLSLTDHDTMAGIPAAVKAARQHGIRLIPGIEISAKNVSREHEEPVHILAYYGSCGPSNCAHLEERLAHVCEGRYHRAREMVDKLKSLNKPIEFENVLRIAGEGVAPARPHVARALVEAGHVENVGEAFTKYISNDGPAYATGAELPAEEVVTLIQETGGVSVLAHPWTLKDPMPLIDRLKSIGLHGMEVFTSDGKSSVFAPVAEACKLVKLGGSDYHATGVLDETDLGGVTIPPLALNQFLKLAEPVWCSAVNKILQEFAEHTSGKTDTDCFCSLPDGNLRGDIFLEKLDHLRDNGSKQVSLTLSPWLSEEERNAALVTASSLGLMHNVVTVQGRQALVVY